ncbi:hypothetical protein SDRG_00759 [Saprolegnia diclina VS20]|uniref:Uncharacterized protein n=1 Tax=Saprolegnia diclina (strain VS20) TaxID=1156394 RepID=T0QUL6_SAPDV|nr:hypothetical protein SDRG_00759 [Saprolegnia diclina VS20]EQC41904.1 hypothetical protein SDRG_00759 [Saprolegnia diclina VS20]|eukprot:XP_008604473.1 hypothetical protein SDRG_00759 [Saprolegnia diclina VS20]
MVRVKGSSSPGVAAHEAAMRQYRAVRTLAYANAMPHGTLPELSVKGVDYILQWPLPQGQMAQLVARYAVNGSIVVPAPDVYITNQDAWKDVFDAYVLDVVDSRLEMTTTDIAVCLSHACIDTNGTANALTPSAESLEDAENHGYNVFGTLVLLLPSAYSGGALTISYDGKSTSIELGPMHF